MDVTPPIGVATVVGTPPAGGVPDVLMPRVGTGAGAGDDGFAAVLAMLDPNGVEPAALPVKADVDGDADDDAAQTPELGTLAIETLGILARAATPTIVVASPDAAATEA